MDANGHGATRMAHINLTRNLGVTGTRLTELARRASMSKQAMGELVDQCQAMGLVCRSEDPSDKRARIVAFTAAGLEWLEAFRDAVRIAEQEMRRELGEEAMDTITRGLMIYAGDFGTIEPD